MKSEALKGVLSLLVRYYQQVGAGHTQVMLTGVQNSDRMPFVIVPSPGMERALRLDPRKCRVVTLYQLNEKLHGASGPIAWEHSALQEVFRSCLSRISELEADVQDLQQDIQAERLKNENT